MLVFCFISRIYCDERARSTENAVVFLFFLLLLALKLFDALLMKGDWLAKEEERPVRHTNTLFVLASKVIRDAGTGAVTHLSDRPRCCVKEGDAGLVDVAASAEY